MKITDVVRKIGSPVMDKLIIFLVCFIPKFFIARDSIMINTLSDEVSAVSVAAFLAGYDWRDVVSNAGYYGIGYLFLFFPLFKAGFPAVIIYRIILSVNAVLIGLTGIVCYTILNQIFKLENRFVKIAISCTCGCMSIFSTSITRARNEDIYLLCGWLLAYVFLKLLGETTNRSRKKFEFILLSILLYMLTIHSRAVTYIIALILVSGLYWIFFRKKLVSKFFWLYLTVGYVVVEFALKQYQKWIWKSTSVKNASLGKTVLSAFSKVAINFTMIKSVLMIILGQFFTAFSLSGGIFLIAFVIFILFMYQCMKNKDDLQAKEIRLLILGVLYWLLIIITICGQSITWGVKVYQELMSETADYAYCYKAFTYMRYMGSYIPPFVMISFIIAWNDWKLWKRACLYTSTFFIVLFLFWHSEILPYVKDTKSNMEFFISIVCLPKEVNNSITVWYKMFLILFMMLFFWMLLNDRKVFAIKLLVMGVLFTSFERMEIFYNKVFISEENIFDQVDVGCAVIQQLYDKLLVDNMDICVVETRDKTDHQIWYLYQFVNYDLHIIPGSKEEIIETDIIISNGEIGKYLTEDYVCFELDKNEYLYSKNISFNVMIKSEGYKELME